MIKVKKLFKLVAGTVMSLALIGSAIPMTAMPASATTITYLQGDVDGNGQISLADMTMFTRYINGGLAINVEHLTRMDAVQNKVIDIQDYEKMQNCYFGMDTAQTVTSDILTNINNETRAYYKHNMSDAPTIFSPYDLIAPSSNTATATFSLPSDFNLNFDYSNANVVELTKNNGTFKYGSGFIVDNHIIATAAHCVFDKNSSTFVNGIGINVYNDDMTVLEGTYQADYTHIPQKFVECTNGYEDSYDYALIYVSEDLIDDEGYTPWAIGCITDEFMSTNSYLTSTGYTSVNNNITHTRYYSTGVIVDYNQNNEPHNNKSLRINTGASAYGGQSGGPTYYESSYNGNIIKSVVGVTTGGNTGFVWATRFTPAIVRFYLNNSNL